MDDTLTVPTIDFEDMYARCGVERGKDILKEIETMPDAEKERALSVIDEIEGKAMLDMSLNPGARELGRWLTAHGIPYAIVTRNSKRSLDHFNSHVWPHPAPQQYPHSHSHAQQLNGFDVIISRDDGFPPKPDPTAMHHICEQWGAEGDVVVMVGDSPTHDVVFGKRGGATTVLLHHDSEARVHTKTEEEVPHHTIHELQDLARVLWEKFHIDGDLGKSMKLKGYPTPVPESLAARAAAQNDVAALSTVHAQDLFAADGSMNTPFVYACDRGHKEAVRVILDRLWDQALQESTDPASQVRYASERVNAPGFIGATAVSRASNRGHVGVLEHVFAWEKRCLDGVATGGTGARIVDCDIPNVKLQYPLHFAAFKRHPEAVKVLLEHGANTRVVDRKGRTPAEDTSDEAIRSMILEHRWSGGGPGMV